MPKDKPHSPLLAALAWPVVLTLLAIAIVLILKGNDKSNTPDPSPTVSTGRR